MLVVETTDLGVSFGALEVIRDVNFRVDSGETVAVVGPSGSGKSTLLATISGDLDPSQGTVRVEASLVAHVHQAAPTMARRTALDNVAIGAIAVGVPYLEAMEVAHHRLLSVGLGDHLHLHAAGKLSGGERQRLGLARALAMSPDLVLADEPTAQLDRANALSIIELLIGGVLSGTSALIATHDERLASACDRVVHL